MFGEIKGIQIKGICATLPDNKIDNLDYRDKFSEGEIKKQIKVTGMRYRYVAEEGQTAVDLCLNSARELLRNTECAPESISVVIYVSSCKKFPIPSTAFYLQKELGLCRAGVVFDVNLGCSAFVCGLSTIASLLTGMGKGARGLLLVADAPSEYLEQDDKATSMLLSDSGTATLVEASGPESLVFEHWSDGNRYDALIKKDRNHKFFMDGMGVFQFSITDVAESICQFFARTGIERESIDYYVLHQAQKFIVDKVGMFSQIPSEKSLISYDRFANAGGGSLPVTLCANSDKFNGIKRVFVCGFGVGLSWGINVFTVNPGTVKPLMFLNGSRDGQEGDHGF